MFRSLRRRLPRIGRGPRLCVAGICVLLALASAVGSKRGPAASSRSVAVLVAARDLPAGHTLGRRDVRLAHWPQAIRPANARADPAGVVGQRLAGPVVAREPITASRLVGRDLTSRLAAGLVAVPITLDDPHGGDVVHPGDRVDVLEDPRPADGVEAAPAPAPRVAVVASQVLVLAVLPGTDGGGAELVLAVDRPTAVRITRDSSGQRFTVLGDPP